MYDSPSPASSSVASAEVLPRTVDQARLHWTAADWLAVAAIPLIFSVDAIVTALMGVGTATIVADTSVRIILCATLLVLYRCLLAEHWRRFRAAFWRNTGLVLLGAILMQVVVSLVRSALPSVPAASTEDSASLIDPMTAQGGQIALLFFAMLGPLATVMVEEAVFRHTLLVKLPLWGSRVLAGIGIVTNGALFGAVHYFDFGSLLGTVPFMVVGVLFNLVYLWRRNLWHVILMHLVNNAVLGIGALTFVMILRAATGA